MNVATRAYIRSASAICDEDGKVWLAYWLEWFFWLRGIYVAFREVEVMIRSEDWWSLRDVGSVRGKGWLIIPLMKVSRYTRTKLDVDEP